MLLSNSGTQKDELWHAITTLCKFYMESGKMRMRMWKSRCNPLSNAVKSVWFEINIFVIKLYACEPNGQIQGFCISTENLIIRKQKNFSRISTCLVVLNRKLYVYLILDLRGTLIKVFLKFATLSTHSYAYMNIIDEGDENI